MASERWSLPYGNAAGHGGVAREEVSNEYLES